MDYVRSADRGRCGKKGYSKETAHKHMRFMAKSHKRMRCYLCPICFRWHLTSQTQKDSKW